MSYIKELEKLNAELRKLLKVLKRLKESLGGIDPYGNPKGTKYDLLDAETGGVYKKNVEFEWTTFRDIYEV